MSDAAVAIWPPTGLYLDAGDTWTDTNGVEYEVSGASIEVPYPRSLRHVLADAFTSAIGTDTGVTVYAVAPEVPTPPAVVIMPADPYQAPYHAGGGIVSAWAFDVDIVLGRPNADEALSAIERAREVLVAALPAGFRWVEFGEIGEIIIAKKRYLKGSLGVAVATTEGLAQHG